MGRWLAVGSRHVGPVIEVPEIAVPEQARLHGRIAVSTIGWRHEWAGLSRRDLWERCQSVDPEEHVEADNILCVAGLSLFAAAVLWAGLEDVNASLGSPFSASYLAPIYGAVGTGTTTPADTDIGLTAESTNSARQPVISGAIQNASHGNPATVAWAFLFGLPLASVTVAEAGIFAQATSTVNNGSLLDHALISPTVTQSTLNLLSATCTISVGN